MRWARREQPEVWKSEQMRQRFAWLPTPMSTPRVWLWLERYWSKERYERINYEFGTCGWISYERWPS